MSKASNFLNQIKKGCYELWGKFGILPSVAAGQSALESAWGESRLSKQYNNLFGIKGSYKGNSAMMNTWEVYGGKRYDIKDSFRSYPDWETSILDYGVFLTVNQRYKNAIGITNYKNQIRAIHKAGYATDPQYANKVISIIEKYNLHNWDMEVLNKRVEKQKEENLKGYVKYTVKSGDNLSTIAKKYNTTVNKIVNLNGIKNRDLIYVGQVINIPKGTKKKTHVVKKGETVSGIAKKYGTTVKQIQHDNNLKNVNLIYPNQKLKV